MESPRDHQGFAFLRQITYDREIKNILAHHGKNILL